MLDDIKTNFHNYLTLFPDELEDFPLLKEQIEEGQDLSDRKNFKGHVTASGLVISPKGNLLLIFHNKLQRYLQPGGHIEKEKNDISLVAGAMREVAEETRLENITLHPWCAENTSPLMINTHFIPANPKKNEEDHYHHDFMFLFSSDTEDITLNPDEVSQFQWISPEKVAHENSMVGRAIQKMIASHLI